MGYARLQLISGNTQAKIFLLLIVLSCTPDQTWTEEDKQNSIHFFRSSEAHDDAIKLMNKLPSDGRVHYTEDLPLIKSKMITALKEAQEVTDAVLDKAHPNLKKHWRDEYEVGLELFLDSFQTVDYQNQLKSQMLLDQYIVWFNEHNHRIKIPRYNE